MNGSLKSMSASMLGGAALALIAVFAASALGLLPQKLDGRQLRDYLLSHPQLVVDMQLKLQEQEAAATDRAQQAAVRSIGVKAFFDPRIAFVTGPLEAKQTFVEFYDYDCPYCRASLPAVKKYYEAHKNDTRFSFIEFPIPEQHGPGAVLAAKASLAARRQPATFVAFHFALMGEDGAVTEQMLYDVAARSGMDVSKFKKDMSDPSLDQAIDIAHKLAVRAKIDGTPTFMVNGHMRPGAVDGSDLDDLANGKPITG